MKKAGLGTILGIFNVSSLIPLYLFSVGAGSTVYIFIQLSKRVIDSIKSRNENLPTTKKVDITHNRGCN